MKRTTFIIGGIAIISLLIGVWVYMLFFATPAQDGGIFTDFNFTSTDDPDFVPVVTPEPQEPTVDITSPERLRQLTTTPVAGFSETRLTPTSTPEVRYIEAGTGHIFSINLESGEETRVSATTIPLTREGVITPDGQFVMLRSGSGASSEIVIGALSAGSDVLQNFAISGQITSFTATNQNEFLYAAPSGNSLVVRAYNPATNDIRELFTIPFRDVTIQWNSETAGPHYVYPKATNKLEGFVYSYTSGVPTREPASGFGLSAVGSSEALLYSAIDNNQYTSFVYNKTQNTQTDFAIQVIPEKCTFLNQMPTIGVCAAELTELSNTMPDSWYRGMVQFSDDFWIIDTTTGTAGSLLSPESEIGRQISLINPDFNTDDTNLYFQNKIDQTLWMYQYEIPLTE